MLTADDLYILFEILKNLYSIREPDSLWRYVLEQSCHKFQAEGGSFFTLAENDRLEVAAAVGVDEERLRQVPFSVGIGLCGWVAQHQQPALVEDVHADGRFNPMADQVTGRHTRSLLCIPIFSSTQTHGVLELVNGTFGPNEQEFLTVLGQQTAVAYENLLLNRETSQSKMLLESLLVNMSGGLIALNVDGNVTILNPAARQLLQLAPSSALGHPAAAILMDYPLLLEILHRTLASGSTVSRQETPLVVGGQPARFGYSTILITGPNQQILGSGLIFQKLSAG